MRISIDAFEVFLYTRFHSLVPAGKQRGVIMRFRRSLACLFLSVLAAFSQSDRGTITGTVVDPADAVVAAAAVKIKNVNSGAVYQAGTSATGNYTLSQLPAGQYELSVTVPGFKKYVRPGITVEMAQVYRVDVTLEVGSNTESVTVSEAAPLLKTKSGELTLFNRVAGVPLFTHNLNCGCFDPTTTFVLNPAAWTNPAPGQWGTAAAYYSDFRYQRRPVENISFARNFPIKERFN
jgi:hypothetical protein